MSISRDIDLNELNSLEKLLETKSNNVVAALGKMSLNHETDIRFTTFSTLASVIRSVELYFSFRGLYLKDPTWWTELIKINRFPIDQKNPADGINIMIRDFDNYVNVGLYTSTFSITESRLRLFYNYLCNPSNSGKINYDYSVFRIYSDIYQKEGLSAREYYAIELFRIIRNTIHNNGVFTKENTGKRSISDGNNYYNFKGNDLEIIFNKDPYRFYSGYVPDFINSMNLLIQRILPVVIDSLDKLISKLLLINRQITDPFVQSLPAV